jgi:FkbM family methyltransferase
MSYLTVAKPHPIGSNSWFLKETRGKTIFDILILSSLKTFYLGSRVLLKIILGKKRRDKLFVEKGFNFKDFLYNSIEILGLDDSMLLVFSIPQYDYKFYSRITRKVKNFLINDMYYSMSYHKETIINRFCPQEGDVVVDIGAAFGLYTILASKKVGLMGKVIAIEPQKDSFEMLNRNVALNKLSNVTTLNRVVYSEETTVNLYGNYSIIPERAGKHKEEFVETKADTLDHLLQQNGIAEVNWIKIDVEGAEYEVLKGATNILSKSKDIALLIEIHGYDNYKPIVEFLKSYDLEIEFETGNEEVDWKHIIVRKPQ